MSRQISSIVRKYSTKSIKTLDYITKTKLNENESFEKIVRPRTVASFGKLLKSVNPVEKLSGMKYICRNRSLDRLVYPKMSSGDMVFNA